MNNKLINKNAYPPKCEYCKKGRLSPDGESVLCPKKGIVEKDDSCRSYKYDVLKRKPMRMPAVDEVNPDDFVI